MGVKRSKGKLCVLRPKVSFRLYPINAVGSDLRWIDCLSIQDWHNSINVRNNQPEEGAVKKDIFRKSWQSIVQYNKLILSPPETSLDCREKSKIMDAIRKKMQSLKGETDSLYATIQQFEDSTKESNRVSDQVGFPSVVLFTYLTSGPHFIMNLHSW